MLLNLYILIIIISVQTNYCGNWRIKNNNPIPHPNIGRDLVIEEDLPESDYLPRESEVQNFKNIKRFKKQYAYHKANSDEVKYFDNIKESAPSSRATKLTTKIAKLKRNTKAVNLENLKKILGTLLKEINTLEEEKKRQCGDFEPISTEPLPTKVSKKISQAKEATSKAAAAYGAKKTTYKSETQGNKAKWGDWTEWSACSVSCGKGREIRWRHCKADCDDIETEMEEKSCQMPACGPGKIFGIISL